MTRKGPKMHSESPFLEKDSSGKRTYLRKVLQGSRESSTFAAEIGNGRFRPAPVSAFV
jgi:hypothetical protein